MTNFPESPTYRRVVHTLAPRFGTVAASKQLSAAIQRITFHLEPSDGFAHEINAPEGHVKLFFPKADGSIVMPPVLPDGNARWSPDVLAEISPFRDYTIRSYVRGELIIDFVRHRNGIGGNWAMQAKIGDRLGVFGPKSSKCITPEDAAYILLADETALPALCRWLEILPAQTSVHVYLETENTDSDIALPEHRGAHIHRLHRNGAPYGSRLLECFETLPLQGDVRLWAAGEAAMIRALRRHLRAQHFPREHMDLEPYWKHGTQCFNPHMAEEAE